MTALAAKDERVRTSASVSFSDKGIRDLQKPEMQEVSEDHVQTDISAEEHVDTVQAERRLVRKLDRVIIPITALLYLSAYLDRGNVGNARLQGLQDTVLGGSDVKYDIVLCAFYITYIVFGVPGTLAAKAILPSQSMAIGALIWSIAATALAGAQTFGGAVTARLFVGIGESLFGAAVALHYSIWYRKDEISTRLALYIGAGVLAGAFGGLIAYGVAHIKSSIDHWRILFLIEGLPSLVLAGVTFFVLPSRPESSRYITEEERALIQARLRRDSIAERGVGVQWSGVRRALTDWKTYTGGVLWASVNLTLGSVTGFLPTIVKGLGYSNTDAQLFTVPPYAVAFVTMYLFSYASDRTRLRGPFIAGVFVCSVTGWLILLLERSSLSARYLGCILIVMGGYNAIPLILSWQSNNTGSESQRAVSLGMLNTIGQTLSIVAAFSFPSSEGPRYVKGISLNIAFNILGLCVALAMSLYYRLENARRDRLEGGPPEKGYVIEVVEKFDLATGFRYMC